MSKKQVVHELHKPARRNFPRRRTVIKGFDDLWQADLAEFIPYARENKGNKYILIVIDCFSKYVFARALKSKTSKETTTAMENILKNKDGRVPHNLQTDNGKEFYNQDFTKLMKKYGINHYSTYSVKKASIAERAIKTIKGMLYRQFSERGKYKWIDILDEIIFTYNNRKHRTIGLKPSDVKPNTRLDVFKNLKIFGKRRYKVGDIVRISKFKGVFDRGFTSSWSSELFKIVKVQITNPATYILEDLKGQPVAGGFYEQELQKTKYPDIYLVEKVLRRKGNKVYVKWLGIDERSWINKDNVVN